MRTLAIETATEACSIALIEEGTILASRHEILGRGHAEQLVPMIAALPDRGKSERIVVSLGPGSFTGVRIGIATARALGLAWGAQVLGYPTLALVAAMARRDFSGAVSVCMAGGHGEWFVQDFSADGQPEQPLASLKPTEADLYGNHRVIAGSRAAEKANAGAPDRTVLDLLPDARHFPLVPGSLVTSTIAPIYGRAPDARLPA
jgi:tRNA threonylcarbamoyladenosine biosynthesis protein TsaB